jgi:hypothetical protein
LGVRNGYLVLIEPKVLDPEHLEGIKASVISLEYEVSIDIDILSAGKWGLKLQGGGGQKGGGSNRDRGHQIKHGKT